MKSTRDDALNLIRHWQSEDAQLRCTYASEGVGVTVTGRGAELSDDSALSITGCPVGHPEVARWPVREFVGLRLRTGDTLTMAEVRTASSPGDQCGGEREREETNDPRRGPSTL